jgi:general secretion pathway protein H
MAKSRQLAGNASRGDGPGNAMPGRSTWRGDGPGNAVAGGSTLRTMRGFSLLEIVLVIAIIALASLLAAAALTGGIDGLRLRSAAREVAAQLRYTRAQALATGVPQRFTIDPHAHTWTAPKDRHGELPKQLGIVFTGAREVQPSRGEGAIVFFADGASTGGRVQLQVDDAAWKVDVAWLTGQVRLARVEAMP